jgi:acyl-CoA synthetase (AMP-forming)/AMP-acid ligase II
MNGGQTTSYESFGDLFRRAVRLYPDKTVVEQDDRRLTYAELEDRTQRAAGLLARLGIGRGSKVFLAFPNDFRFIECLFGTLRAGAVAVPANIRLGAEALAYIAGHCDAEVLIAHASLKDKVPALRKAAPALRHVLLAGGEAPGTEPYDSLIAHAAPATTTAPATPSDVAMIMYTSGSTGRPKGCLLSHGNKWWQTRSSARTMLLDERDKALVMGPLYHANALWVCLLPMLHVGGGLTILPGFDPEAVLEAIERHRPTFTSGTPSMFTQLLESQTRHPRDVSSLQVVLCGSAPVSAELMTNLTNRFGCEVVEGYGLTEGGANVETPRWGIKKLGSAGLPVPDVEVRVVDPGDPSRDCAPGEVGELWTRSPANALGYYKLPEITAQKFTPEGWLRTGDLVRADEQGYLYIVGRADDMINCGGENIYPKEVEHVLLGHPAVADACVVPAPHKIKGQAPVAWVVLRTHATASEDELKRYFLERGAPYAHPRRIFFLDRLPVTGTNKVDRKMLADETRRHLPEGLGSAIP